MNAIIMSSRPRAGDRQVKDRALTSLHVKRRESTGLNWRGGGGVRGLFAKKSAVYHLSVLVSFDIKYFHDKPGPLHSAYDCKSYSFTEHGSQRGSLISSFGQIKFLP